ncbi:hypothetical protein QFZ46_001781 [Microbacterium murale]|uniref:Uncharacterized protein n=2 Tax=Microbacterium murale TaxID=1081040 RepID=A0ABU0P8F4_9MICO|nr:hypothetical protein [Microbacterium murale]
MDSDLRRTLRRPSAANDEGMDTFISNPEPAPTPPRPSAPSPVPLLVAAVLVAVVTAVALLVGSSAEYSAIFPPAWLGFVGSVLAVVAIVCNHSAERVAEASAWVASLMLLGASGGVVLDALRAFFAVTGIPAGAFSVVDLPGFAARLMSLVAAFAALRFARALRRSTLDPARSGERRGARRILLLSGLVLCVPYPLLKIVWWMSGDQSEFEVGFPAMELAAFSIAALGLLMLCTSAGARLPRRLVSLGGWCGSFVLLSMGALMLFGLLSQRLGLVAADVDLGDGGRAVMVFAVYSTWFALGAIVAAATVLYEEATTRDVPAGRSAAPARR